MMCALYFTEAYTQRDTESERAQRAVIKTGVLSFVSTTNTKQLNRSDIIISIIVIIIMVMIPADNGNSKL